MLKYEVRNREGRFIYVELVGRRSVDKTALL